MAHLELPTLRNRPGDILPLAEHFVSEYTRRLGYADIRLDDSAKQKLLQHSWPGNIRELENVIHHSLLICRNNLVRSEDLHLSSISLHRPRQEQAQQAGSHGVDLLEDALQQLFESGKANLYEHFEDALVKAAYHHCHHNQVQTAKLLGLSRNVLRAKLIKMGAINALK